ncbi:hypothetical protein ABFY72_02395 [Burkholderia gladioli]
MSSLIQVANWFFALADHLGLDRVDVLGEPRRSDVIGQDRLDGEPMLDVLSDCRPLCLVVRVIGGQLLDERIPAGVR